MLSYAPAESACQKSSHAPARGLHWVPQHETFEHDRLAGRVGAEIRLERRARRVERAFGLRRMSRVPGWHSGSGRDARPAQAAARQGCGSCSEGDGGAEEFAAAVFRISALSWRISCRSAVAPAYLRPLSREQELCAPSGKSSGRGGYPSLNRACPFLFDASVARLPGLRRGRRCASPILPARRS